MARLLRASSTADKTTATQLQTLFQRSRLKEKAGSRGILKTAHHPVPLDTRCCSLPLDPQKDCPTFKPFTVQGGSPGGRGHVGGDSGPEEGSQAALSLWRQRRERAI